MTHPLIHALVEAGSDPAQPSEVDPTEAPSTAQVLQAMLTENTGRHMLDSGGAYGRAWERNQGVDFDAKPEASVEVYLRERGDYDRNYGDGELTLYLMVTLDVYHWLLNRVDYDAELDAEFERFSHEGELADAHWLECAEAFAEARADTGHDFSPMVVNTYNGEDALSQTLQYVAWSDAEEDEYLVALQIHGGCDVRGGYTQPRIFRLGDYDGIYYLLDNARIEAWCDGSGEPEHNPEQLGIDGEPIGRDYCGANWTSDAAGYGWMYDGGTGPNGLDEFNVERGTEGKKGVLVVDEGTNTIFCPICGHGKVHFGPSCVS